MITVTVYCNPQSTEYLQLKGYLEEIQKTIPHQVVVVENNREKDISQKSQDDELPVVEVGPYRLHWPVTIQQLTVAIGAARDRAEHLEKIGDEAYEARKLKGEQWSRLDRFAFWFSRHYMLVFNTILFLYVGLPFLAPVFLRYNLPGPAKVIYAIYRPLCHQLTYRSFFIFGEQWVYPRELSGLPVNQSYEELTGNNPLDMEAARNFVGNEHAGYKIALCERDIAIWGSLFLFGLVFAVFRTKIKSLPWYVWLILGVLPMGIDGGTQLIGLIGSITEWFPARESTPLLRMITGTLFGLTTAWFVFPVMEENMRDTRKILTQKKLSIEIKGKKINS